MMVDIDGRKLVTVKIEGQKTKVKVVRQLSCGHNQDEPSGGKAKQALTAECKECVRKP